MALSIDVKLDKSVVPTWPDRCVVCDRLEPNHSARFSDRSTNLWTTITMQFAKKVQVSAPACPDCGPGLERRHRLEKVGMVITAVGGTWLGLWLVAPMFEAWPKALVAGACGLATYAPLIAIRIFWAPPFSITAWDDTIDYEFANEGYAREFAELNQSEVT